MLIGVLGGGQLGRMLALAGQPLGLEFRFWDPHPEAVRGLGECVVADFRDPAALVTFCQGLDVATYEFENVPLETARQLTVPLRPGLRALEIAQDRLLEKQFFAGLGLPTAPYRRVDSAADLPETGLLKTRRLGYDGKGQWRLPAPFPGVPCLAEELVPFTRELALLIVRGLDGEVRTWPWVETIQKDGILVEARAPVAGPALDARALVEALDFVGVLAVEFFEVDGQLVANELAPRVHNSGHWTIEGSPTSQFENHLRAILGWPLGPTEPCRPCRLQNLIGELPAQVNPGVHLHDYGKTPRAGRKVGHMTTLDRPKEECGVLGLYAPHDEVARMAFFGLFALQHRGQEAAGIAVSDGHGVRLHKGLGLVSQAFDADALKPLEGFGPYAIGHTRYSTTGSSQLRNAQPFLIETRHGPVALAHNGNLVNASALRQQLLENGVGLSSSSDTEVMTMMLAGAVGDTWEERLRHCMPAWEGAYCLTVLTREGVFGVRDPRGFRPLVVGELPGGGQVVASETGALHTLGCTAHEEVQPGQIVKLGPAPARFPGHKPCRPLALCVFEHIYFSRPDNVFDGLTVHAVRQRLGEELAREAPVEADVVIPVPDSSVPAAIGYARVSGLEYNDGFIKNRYIGRTFIEPTDSLRRQGVAMKFNPLAENLRDRRVVMIDDSIVRGNTSGPLVKMLREAGAREVHLRITSPPICHPCYMGVDMGTYAELIAHRHSVEEIRQLVGCDSLQFLSMEGVYRALGRSKGYCDACFTGRYPLPIPQDNSKTGFEAALA